MDQTGRVNHFTDDGDLPLLWNDVIVGRDAEVVVDGVAEGHRDHGTDGFAVTIEVIPEKNTIQTKSKKKSISFENHSNSGRWEQTRSNYKAQ